MQPLNCTGCIFASLISWQKVGSPLALHSSTVFARKSCGKVLKTWKFIAYKIWSYGVLQKKKIWYKQRVCQKIIICQSRKVWKCCFSCSGVRLFNWTNAGGFMHYGKWTPSNINISNLSNKFHNWMSLFLFEFISSLIFFWRIFFFSYKAFLKRSNYKVNKSYLWLKLSINSLKICTIPKNRCSIKLAIYKVFVYTKLRWYYFQCSLIVF